MLCSLAQQDGLRKAAQLAQRGVPNVLFDDPSLLDNKNEFRAAKQYLHSLGIEPSILIVRSTRERITAVARERFQSGSTSGLWKGRALLGMYEISRSISYPGADRVIIHDNVSEIGQSVAEVRRRILAGELNEGVEWPMRLVIP